MFSFSFRLFAQTQSNYREKEYPVRDTILLDSLSIVPNSVRSFGIDTDSYQILPGEAKLVWQPGKKPISGTIKISYRVFPFLFTKSFYHKELSEIETGEKGTKNPFYYSVEKPNEDILFAPGLNKQGSISRSISFGNNQDLSVNSNLNLQLSGRLTENVNVLAAITDDNIPIQPEGNTQQLQEFDQVYIQLFNDQGKLKAGDFQLKNPEGYFMKYLKKARGISAESIIMNSGSGKIQANNLKNGNQNNNNNSIENSNRVKASAAISRGKFSRYIVQGIEGNQGPYRLKGSDNEAFIIVLSGTERVFMDGQLLVRGQENDYTIDYNSAEIIFTAKRLVTKDKRIIIEFQYSDKNYARSLIQFSDEYSTARLKLLFSLFSEQDSKNQPLQIDLSDKQKLLLSQIGDSLQYAISENIQSAGFSDTEVRYKKIDSLGYDSVFVYSINPDSAIYRLGFSNVGETKGDYIQISSGANGRVFQWVAPDTINGLIIKKGNYLPIELLISPKKKQMGTLGANYLLSKNTVLSFELAGSNNDLNTFSEKDSKNDQGYAFKIKLENRTPLFSFSANNVATSPDSDNVGKSTSNESKEGAWNLISTAGYEKVDKNFTFLEWFRPAEFDRDWNLRNYSITSTQHISEAAIGLEKKGTGNFRYQLNSIITEPASGIGKREFTGVKNSIFSNIKTKKFDFDLSGSLMRAETGINSSEFSRNKTGVVKRFKFFTIGGRNDYEKNLFMDYSHDTLLSGSYEFLEWELFLSNPDSAKNRYVISYDQRKDFGLKQSLTTVGKPELKESTLGEFMSFSYDILKNEKIKIRGKSTYRKLYITDKSIAKQEPDNTLLNRIEYNLRMFKEAISISSFYEIGSGLENKKEFSFFEVPAGQGVFGWNDYNNNGIKELNEFEISAFPDQAKFVKVYTLSSEFIKTYTNQFNQTVFVQPSSVWNNKAGMKGFIARFSDNAVYRIDRKTTRENAQTSFNPFLEKIADTTLVTLNSSFRNTFFFNRTHPKFGLEANYQNSKSKSLLTNGFETRNSYFREISLRQTVTSDFLFNLLAGDGVKKNNSEFFSSRNFFIRHQKIQPKITFQPGTAYRISLFYEYLEKTNKEELGGEKSISRKIGFETRVNSPGKGSLLLNANFILLSYNNVSNTSLAFEMLEGLLPGNNITWAASYQQTLANNLQLSLNYNGRVSENSKVIHSGGIQVRAFF